MKIDVRPRARNAPRPAWKTAEAFAQWCRGRDCACGGRNPNCDNSDIQFAHGPHKASKGIGTKCADRYGMPLSLHCHALQHSIGWQTFARLYLPGEPLDVCEQYWRLWPGRAKWEARL